jgi:hypothetical protein
MTGKDHTKEKDRIQEKHHKQRLQERDKKDNNEAQGEAVTLTLGDMDDLKGESKASAKSESYKDESKDEAEVIAQEDLAVAVICNSS